MHFIFLVLAAVGVSHAGSLRVGEEAPVCASWSRLYEGATTRSRPLGSVVRDAVSGEPGRDVLVLGEVHNEETYALYRSILPMIREADPAIDCAFIENPSSTQKSLERYARGEIGFREYQDEAVRAIGETPYEGDEYLGLSIEVSARNGWKVFAVDADKTEVPDMLSGSVRSVETRNALMAEKVDRLIRTGACRRGVLIVGAAHLRRLRGTLNPVTEHLGKRGLSSRTVMLHPSKWAILSSRGKGDGCSRDFPQPAWGEVFAVSTRDLDDSTRASFVSDDYWGAIFRVGDAAAWIFYPFPN